MFKNYLKIAFRALLRSKVHSAINITGLSLGIACCMLITLYVKDEWTFDRFHSKAERIYRAYVKENWGENQEFFNTVTPFPMGPALKQNFPEVESQVRLMKQGIVIKQGSETFNETITVAGQDFFKVFDFKIIKGSAEGALDAPYNLVLNQATATKYFGDQDPIGKTIVIQVDTVFEEYNVVAITENAPTNSSIRFNFMISDVNLPRLVDAQSLTSGWFNVHPETYVLLQDGTDVKNVESKFPAIFKTLVGEGDFGKSKYTVGLQPLTSIHLDVDYPLGYAPVSDPKYSLVLGAVALLILIVACINFVTLSIGRSIQRAKEVGIRKVVGAARTQIMVQFVGEAILVSTLSMIIGVAVAAMCLPGFNNLAAKQLAFPYDGFLIGVVAALLSIIGLIAGSYPAFVLSGFRPVAILKGSITTGNSKQTFRKVLVGAQLVLSIFLISCTIVMRDQLNFLRDKNLGFNKEQLVSVPLNINVRTYGEMSLKDRVDLGFQKAEQFKTALNGKPGVNAACAASHDFRNAGWTYVGFTDDKSIYHNFYMNVIDDDYIPVLNMEMASGRNFNEGNTSDRRRSMIINESLAREYGWTDAIGKKLPGKKFGDHEIIGVVKDFNFTSLYSKVPPLAIVQDPNIILAGIENISSDQRSIPKLFVRLNAGETSAGLKQIEQAWNELAPGEEFEFSFVDQSLNAQYAADQNLGNIISIATILAILIGSLGLYGLASLAMQNRTKEITIRKVLGATQQSLLVLLSREYVILISICLLISVPFTLYMMSGWLSTFEYRVHIGWTVFLVSGGISLAIALITIGHQTIKTAWTQPAQALKYE